MLTWKEEAQRKKKKRKEERGEGEAKCANLGNHSLEGDVFVVNLILPFSPFFIWPCYLKPGKIKDTYFTQINKEKLRKRNTFWVSEIGIFANFSPCH